LDERTMVLIPAFNEGARLPALLARILEHLPDADIVVVDDGSVDDTAAAARSGGATVLRHPFNMGYGAALQTGYKYALSRPVSRVVQMDGDGQHDPGEIRKLLEPLDTGAADLVVGSRFLEPTHYHMGRLRTLGRLLFGWLARMAGLSVTDPTSGFQALDREVLELYARDFFPSDYPDVDVLLMAHRHGARVVERSVQMSEGARASTMHRGFRTSVYYVYKMLLSLIAVSREPKRVSHEER
jgi:glycosyltransferase involved in cell wall biosynthesis